MTNLLLTGDRSLIFCQAVVLWLMTQQLASDIDNYGRSVTELRRLEGAPPSFPSVRVLSGGSRLIRVGIDGGDQTEMACAWRLRRLYA